MISLIYQVLNGGEQTAPPDWSPSTTTDKDDNDDTQSTTTENDDNDDTQSTTTKKDDNGDDETICVKDGANADPKDCSRYYLCHRDQDGEWIETPQACPSGLFFNPDFLYCDFPDNVDCDENVSI